VAVSGKYNISDLAPSLVLLSQRIVERWLLQPVWGLFFQPAMMVPKLKSQHGRNPM